MVVNQQALLSILQLILNANSLHNILPDVHFPYDVTSIAAFIPTPTPSLLRLNYTSQLDVPENTAAAQRFSLNHS